MCSFAEELTHLREKVKTLEEHEAEFGQKRAKFKEIYMQKESTNIYLIDNLFMIKPYVNENWKL